MPAATPAPDSAPAAVVPVMTGAYAPSTEVAVRKSGVADLLQARSGLKYLVAALVLVALVILLVVFSLRGDSNKKPVVHAEPMQDDLAKIEPPKAPEEPSAAPAPAASTVPQTSMPRVKGGF